MPPETTPHSSPSAGRIAAASALALAAAGLGLVTVVLPAEYGIDPLGSGRALGLTALSEQGPRWIQDQEEPFRRDQVEFVLGPYQSLEYKYRLEEGASLLYAWRSSRPIRFDLHGEALPPEQDPVSGVSSAPPPETPPAAASFASGESQGSNGSFAAPFAGVHGWYWENAGGGEAVIRLSTAGFYREPREYFDGGVYPRQLPEP